MRRCVPRIVALLALGAGARACWLQIRVAAPGGTSVLGTPAALVALDAAF